MSMGGPQAHVKLRTQIVSDMGILQQLRVVSGLPTSQNTG